MTIMKSHLLHYINFLIRLHSSYKLLVIFIITILTIFLEKWVHLWADVSFIYTIPMVVSLFFFPTLLNTTFSFFLYSAIRILVRTDHVSIDYWLIFVTHAMIACVHVALFRLTYYLIDQKNQYKQMFLDFISSLAHTLDMKDPYTANHSMNVAIYSRRLGEEIGLSPALIETLFIGGLLHDIGKIGVPSSILNKTSFLSENEFIEIKKHPEHGFLIIQGNGSLDPAIFNIVLHHHERWDGKGYPYGLAKESIPLVARIVCIADSFDAITTHRSYQKRRTIEEGLEEIDRCKGVQFDPELADAFVRMVKKNQLEIAHEIKTVKQQRLNLRAGSEMQGTSLTVKEG